ncbi:Gldg family protein [Sphingosinicella sp. LY1275]|uniref:Gldg family protein n=1 Tax=Sphingosinicella sp. LY1275 TaxID=3095379 RepID=UPI002ADEF229|nr:Gldg family protein [Sphingosinicella sp. LY1275]MEA1015692.1 Gldg family protein [Sphingosinicella sp. LY1275]
MAGAACFAAAELLVTLALGRFFDWGRAEALLFFAFRPWLLLMAAAAVGGWPWRRRLFFYTLALVLAAVGESLFLLSLGATEPWAEMLRGLAGGALLALAFDLVIQALLRLSRWGRWVGAAMIGALLLVPGSLQPYESLVLAETARRPDPARPELMLMTALPIVWGEGGAFDPSSRPALAYRMLEEEFRVRPLDLLDDKELARGGLLLLAQPRVLAPQELVALDAWIRRGGRALILTDPLLVWPSDLPLGDSRRPPPTSWLGPLLGHWGLRLDRPSAGDLVVRDLASGRRLALAAPGSFVRERGDCIVAPDRLTARCPLGRGAAWLVADADLLRDALWAGPGQGRRHERLADNPLVLADWLDGLAGLKRERLSGDVQWLRADPGQVPTLLLGLLPAVLALIAAFLAARLRHG